LSVDDRNNDGQLIDRGRDEKIEKMEDFGRNGINRP